MRCLHIYSWMCRSHRELVIFNESGSNHFKSQMAKNRKFLDPFRPSTSEKKKCHRIYFWTAPTNFAGFKQQFVFEQFQQYGV